MTGIALVYLTASVLGEVEPSAPLAYTSVLVFFGVAFSGRLSTPHGGRCEVDPIVALRT
jgi:hypothetical protein